MLLHTFLTRLQVKVLLYAVCELDCDKLQVVEVSATVMVDLLKLLPQVRIPKYLLPRLGYYLLSRVFF